MRVFSPPFFSWIHCSGRNQQNSRLTIEIWIRFFSTNTLLFRWFSAKFLINCQNMNFFLGLYFLKARFSSVLCYYFAQKFAKVMIWRVLKREFLENGRNFHASILNFVNCPFFWYWILWSVCFSDIEFCEISENRLNLDRPLVVFIVQWQKWWKCM